MSSTTAAPEQKFRIAIVGGGIGGLTCAIALKDCPNFEINLYEQAHQITEIGAGITLWPRSWQILKALGLEEDLLKTFKNGRSDKQGRARTPWIVVDVDTDFFLHRRTYAELAFEHRLSDRENGITFLNLYAKGGAIPFHRQELQQILLKHIPKFCSVHLSHRLTKCEEEQDGVKLFFNDGSEATCDVAFCADGIKSIGRELIPNKGVLNSGTEAFRALIPKETLAKQYPTHRTLDHPVIYCGKNKHIVVYPISKGQIVNVAAMFSKQEDEGKPLSHPKIKDATTREVLDEFAGWEPEAFEKTTRWEIGSLYPLDTYVSRRVALLGDAVHAMPPHLGAGAGQAIEDGYMLGRLFTIGGDLPKSAIAILKAYNRVRLPFGNMVKRHAREQGHNYELNTPGLDIKAAGQELTSEQMDVLCKAVSHDWSRWEDDVEVDVAKGIELLKQETAENSVGK